MTPNNRNLKVYSIYDSAVEVWCNPFFLPNKGAALRSWAATANDPSTQIYANPGDFTLFEIGEWNDETGVIHMYEAKINLGLALEFKSKPENITPIHEVQQ